MFPKKKKKKQCSYKNLKHFARNFDADDTVELLLAGQREPEGSLTRCTAPVHGRRGSTCFSCVAFVTKVTHSLSTKRAGRDAAKTICQAWRKEVTREACSAGDPKPSHHFLWHLLVPWREIVQTHQRCARFQLQEELGGGVDRHHWWEGSRSHVKNRVFAGSLCFGKSAEECVKGRISKYKPF